MPDPSVDPAMAEAYALAPKGVVIHHTLEIRHPSFVNEAGEPDSGWVVLNQTDITARIEAGAPLRAGELVTFQAMQFQFALAPIELSPAPELELTLATVARPIVENLDRAVTDTTKIVACYRPYLSTDLSTPRMLPPPTFDLSQVSTSGATQMKARARNGIDLRGNFPRIIYTAQYFPGLVGR